MITGVICSQEIAKANNNVLNEFANFNKTFVWNKPTGGSNATILNNIGGRHSYLGIGCVSINFSGTSAVTFNAGDSSMQRVIQRDGNYILSYAFDKSDPTSDITFTVNLYVNGVLQPDNTITQNLYNTSGFIDGQYNRYFQNVALSYGDVIDFSFTAQSDTTSCYLYFDALELEIDNKGGGFPTIYTEAPLDIFEEENTITVGAIASGETKIITASLTGAKINTDLSYIAISAPSELATLGLSLGVPILVSDNVVKFSITNNTVSTITPSADSVYNLKVIR